MLCADDVHVRAGPAGPWLLRGVSLELRPGEVLGVVGPNGAGKSTLLRVLSGALRPQAGRITLYDRALATWPARELARHRAVMAQHAELRFPLSAREVVLLGRIPHHLGAPGLRDHDIARQALEQVGVAALAERSWERMSGGERQRVQLARALAQIWEGPGRILLLDEPTASLDLAQQHHALRQARRLAAEGVAVAVILHDLNLAAAYTDRLLVLRGGQPLALAPTAQALHADTILAAFGVPVHVLHHPDGGILIASAATAPDRKETPV